MLPFFVQIISYNSFFRRPPNGEKLQELATFSTYFSMSKCHVGFACFLSSLLLSPPDQLQRGGGSSLSDLLDKLCGHSCLSFSPVHTMPVIFFFIAHIIGLSIPGSQLLRQFFFFLLTYHVNLFCLLLVVYYKKNIPGNKVRSDHRKKKTPHYCVVMLTYG